MSKACLFYLVGLALNISLVRYPGGNFVCNYHWLDCIGYHKDKFSVWNLNGMYWKKGI
jgi:alpha-L-arabinofuranosidase